MRRESTIQRLPLLAVVMVDLRLLGPGRFPDALVAEEAALAPPWSSAKPSEEAHDPKVEWHSLYKAWELVENTAENEHKLRKKP